MAACASPATTPRDTPAAATEPPPRFAAGGPDAEELGAGRGLPDKAIARRSSDVGMAASAPTAISTRSSRPGSFTRRRRPRASCGSPSRAITWQFQGADLTLDDYLARTPTTGLLIARGDTILVERYQYGRTDRHRFTSWSMAKTVTAMLVGIAIAEGHIRSVDDPAAAYVPELAGTEYGRTSLRHLLQMSSGVRFSEQYTGTDDVSRLAANTFLLRGAGGPSAVTPFNERAAAAGTKFSYASVETQVLGLVLRAATGRPPAEYLESRIWQPIGAEADATWLVDDSGQEATFCCLNAVLRDYARLGLLLAHDGNWRGRQVVPAAWVREATTTRADQPHLWPGAATPFFGYGYQTWIVPSWILPGDRRMFVLWGVRGQRIYVDPQSKLVMVNTAVHKQPVDLPQARETDALWTALVRQLGD